MIDRDFELIVDDTAPPGDVLPALARLLLAVADDEMLDNDNSASSDKQSRRGCEDPDGF